MERFNQYAAERGVHPAQLAVAWVRHSPGITSPIVGASSLSQLETSVGAFEFDLSDVEYDTITHMFETEVKEEGLQRFPDKISNFPRLRRNLNLTSSD
jgi:aryl-alcohol dehydrogenase-like predicted oxidoreductase